MADPVKSRYTRFKENPVIKLGDRVINLSECGPLTLKDKRELRVKHGINIGSGELSPEEEEKLVWYCLQRSCEGLKQEELDDLPLGTAEDIVNYVGDKGKEVNYPFLMPPTGSVPRTGGAGQT